MSESAKVVRTVKFEGSCCANCKFFDKFPVQKKPDNILGACKCNPPYPSNEYEEGNKIGRWPLVLGTFWCGMFFDVNRLD